jgi:hypothetical protein
MPEISRNAGIDNALKMREMFNSDPNQYKMWASFYCEYPDIIEVRLSAFNSIQTCIQGTAQFDQPQSTYRFNDDGSYSKVTHL